MIKTSLKSKYFNKLASVNDQLCYFHFADEEVRKIIEKLEIGDQSKMTTEIFPANAFSQRIRVKFLELLAFRDSSKATTAGMSISFGVEHLLYYLEDITNFKLKISSASESQKESNNPEEKMHNNLIHWGVADVDTGIIKAISYLRLRRNHIIHANSQINETFERFLRKESHHLNAYWSARTSVDGLDFSDKNIGTFTVDEVYTCMKLLRVCLEEIDLLVASTFTAQDLINYLTMKILDRDKKLKGSLKSLSRKVRRCLADDFGVDVSFDVVQVDVEAVLKNA